MAMNLGARDENVIAPAMNVTPLVDIVLVLLIIFMVITPLLAKQFWVHTPKQEQREVEQLGQDPEAPLVLRVGADRSIEVNGTKLEQGEVADRLRRMFAARTDHILFFDADDSVPLSLALDLLDAARAGGAVTIATLTKPLASEGAARR